jgi:SAM-dependent methyltransferase
MSDPIPRSEGRAVFGRDAALYDAARPAYPERVFGLLVERCGLRDGCRTLEVGAGSGLATRRLLERGARPLVAVEPDRAFGSALESLARSSPGRLVPVFSSFESADVPEAAFDLAVCAMSFHWLDPALAPRKLGACLGPGGWLALFWNVFGDPREPDAFHEATAPLLSSLPRTPSHSREGALPFALDREARRADFEAAGADRDFAVEEVRWTLRATAPQVRALYATFASVARLPDPARAALLDGIESIAETRFGGVVERRMVTPIYLGRRR